MKDFPGKLEPTAISRIGRVVNTKGVRLDQSHERPCQIDGRSRCTALIIDNSQLGTRLTESQHRLDKVSFSAGRMMPVETTCSHDKMLLAEGSESVSTNGVRRVESTPKT